MRIVHVKERARFHSGADLTGSAILDTGMAGMDDHIESAPIRLDLPERGAAEAIELVAHAYELNPHVRFVVLAGAAPDRITEPVAVLRWSDRRDVVLHHDVTGLLPPGRQVFLKVRFRILPGVAGDEASYLYALGLRRRS